MFRFSTSRLSSSAASTPKPLAALIQVIANNKIDLKPDDIFKLCVTANGKDGKQLGLLENRSFVSALRDAAARNISALNPFQMNQVKEMCTKAGIEFINVNSTSSSPSSTTTTESPSQQKTSTTTTTQLETTSKTVGEKLWDTTTTATSSPTTQQHQDTTTAPATTTAGKEKQPFQVDEKTDPKILQDIMDVLFVANQTFDERNTYDLRKVQEVTNNTSDTTQNPRILINLLPYISAKPLLHIIKTLAHINHQDYVLATKLSRRACELASTLTVSQCTRVLVNLYRLKVQDSLTVIVRKIENEPNPLSTTDMLNIIHAAHAQTHVSAALQPLVSRTLFELSGLVGPKHMSIHQLVQCVEVAAKFGQASNPHVRLIVDAAGRRASELSDRLLASTVQHAHAMNLISPQVFAQLHDRAVALVTKNEMDLRFLEPLLDVFSLLPFNSAPFMDGVLLRLADDAGKLHVTNLVSVIELIASYPGAKGSQAVPALALAAAMRKEMLDQHSLITVVLGLAQLRQFSDEFFDVLEFLCSDQRKGFKKGIEVIDLLSYIDNLNGQLLNDAKQRFLQILIKVCPDLIPSMTQEEALELQKQFHRLGIDDRGLNRRITARLESLSVERAEAERAANVATMRRAHQQQTGHQHQTSGSVSDDWNSVQRQKSPQQPRQDLSGWGEAEVKQTQKILQHQHQQQNQQGKLSSRQMAAMSKNRQQQNAPRNQQQQQQQKKKPFNLKNSHWEIE